MLAAQLLANFGHARPQLGTQVICALVVRHDRQHPLQRGAQSGAGGRNQFSSVMVELAPNARLLHVRAGPARHVTKHELVAYLPEFVAGAKRLGGGGYALVHGHYYLSGWAGAVLAHSWQIPHVQSFHTLARVRNGVLPDAARESLQRIDMEVKVMASADRIIATSPADKQDILGHYGVPPHKVSVIPPGGLMRSCFARRTRRRPGSGWECRTNASSCSLGAWTASRAWTCSCRRPPVCWRRIRSCV